jgi:hypothetical protein
MADLSRSVKIEGALSVVADPGKSGKAPGDIKNDKKGK